MKNVGVELPVGVFGGRSCRTGLECDLGLHNTHLQQTLHYTIIPSPNSLALTLCRPKNEGWRILQREHKRCYECLE